MTLYEVNDIGLYMYRSLILIFWNSKIVKKVRFEHKLSSLSPEYEKLHLLRDKCRINLK